MDWWMWFLLGCILVVLEIVTPGGFYFIFFGASALIVGTLALSGVIVLEWAEWLLFSVFSIGSTALFRRPLLERLGGTTPSIAMDNLVGETAIAAEGIEPRGFGKAELRGTTWNVCNSGDKVLVRGERCYVERVDGLTLFVRSADTAADSN